MKSESFHNGVRAIEPHDPHLLDQLTDLVVWCDDTGIILYINPAAQCWSNTPLIHHPFISLLMPDIATKGERFLDAARFASPDNPTVSWELALGSTERYTTAHFRGYHNGDHIVLVGQVESEKICQMQHELIDLTSELAEAQRELHRQNRALQKALQEQQNLLQTIQELTAPAVPIWENVLLLPLVGYIDSQRVGRITSQLLDSVAANHARYVILDVSGIADIDTTVARHLIDTARSLRLLGTQSVLVGITPTLAETMTHLGIELKDFRVQSDLQHAVAYVLRRLGKV